MLCQGTGAVVRVLVAVAVTCAMMVATAKASADPLPYGMKWVAPGVVLKRLGVRQLQVDTTCASACTVFLRLGNRVCVTDRARIGFHRIRLLERTRFGSRRSPFKSADHSINHKFLQRLPAKIRNWHGIRDGLPLRMAWLQGEEAARIIGRCA
jgi:hypothetical protein